MTAGTIHALGAGLFVIEGERPSGAHAGVPLAAVYHCGVRLFLLGTGSSPAQRAAIRAIAASYGTVAELVLMSSGATPRPDGNDDLLHQLSIRRRRQFRHARDPSSSRSQQSVEVYQDLPGSGSIVIADRSRPGWIFPGSDLSILPIGPSGLGVVGFHIGQHRALIVPDLFAGPTVSEGHLSSSSAADDILDLLSAGRVDVVSAGWELPMDLNEALSSFNR